MKVAGGSRSFATLEGSGRRERPRGLVAERAGFEPARTLRALRAFQARLFVHSSTSPRGRTFHTGLALGWNVSSMANPLMACQRRHRIAALPATHWRRLLFRCSARGWRSRTGTGRRRRLFFARAGVAAPDLLGIRNCSWCVALQLQIQDFQKLVLPVACRAAPARRCGACHRHAGWRARRRGEWWCSGCGG